MNLNLRLAGFLAFSYALPQAMNPEVMENVQEIQNILPTRMPNPLLQGQTQQINQQNISRPQISEQEIIPEQSTSRTQQNLSSRPQIPKRPAENLQPHSSDIYKNQIAEAEKSYAQLMYPDASSCPKSCFRREISTFTQAELTNFFISMSAMRNRGLFQQLADLHSNNNDFIHGNEAFFPWHSYFLRVFEYNIQLTFPEFCLPYWDTSNKNANWQEHPLFTAAFFGSTGADGCYEGGLFDKWYSNVNEPKKCSTRIFDETITVFSSEDFVKESTANVSTLMDFVSSTINAHALPHLAVGGSMSTMYAPVNPEFYFHHSNIERIWLTYGSKLSSSTPNEVLSGFRVTHDAVERGRNCSIYESSKFQQILAPPSDVSAEGLNKLMGSNDTKKGETAAKKSNERKNSIIRKRPKLGSQSVPRRKVSSSFKILPSLSLLILFLY